MCVRVRVHVCVCGQILPTHLEDLKVDIVPPRLHQSCVSSMCHRAITAARRCFRFRQRYRSGALLMNARRTVRPLNRTIGQYTLCLPRSRRSPIITAASICSIQQGLLSTALYTAL
ncbi:hypothetical protein TcWFU_007834 [Taenia crassiceps]|uniref:Uncharacterized protein n=1 Tax=Taenia crassiceps TaxID=6207 RepID=A0ABR4QT58_9CEST